MNFSCRKLKCEHNCNCVCKLKNIEISHNLDCKMHKEDNKKVEDKTKTMFDKVPEFSNFVHHEEVKISCSAQCIFNTNGQCMANGIIVNETKPDNAICVTFLKK